jgi:hypothetical protein
VEFVFEAVLLAVVFAVEFELEFCPKPQMLMDSKMSKTNGILFIFPPKIRLFKSL